MNCSYHTYNAASSSCNGCGRGLCPACDHRIKGFPYCQDCIVRGVDLLRHQGNANNTTFVKKRTLPLVAALLSAVCPGLGAAYNGQTTKALVHFAVFVGLFQMAVLTGGISLFVLGFMGMWAFALVDSWRVAQAIRSGVTPDMAEDILVRRFTGNPKLWGGVLLLLGAAFLFQMLFNIGIMIRAIVPMMLIGLGLYIMRGVIFKPKAAPADGPTRFAFPQTGSDDAMQRIEEELAQPSQFGSWRDH